MACVLEAGEGGGALQCLAQRIDALGGVGALAILVDTTDLVVGEHPLVMTTKSVT